jgi:hypothetical protein
MPSELILFFVILVPFLAWIGVSLFRWLWNITVPQVFGLKEITFWQAFRLLILAGVLFGAGGLVHFNFSG